MSKVFVSTVSFVVGSILGYIIASKKSDRFYIDLMERKVQEENITKTLALFSSDRKNNSRTERFEGG